jgi:hypothetical protein
VIFEFNSETLQITGTKVEVKNIKKGNKIGNERIILMDDNNAISQEKFGNSQKTEV